MPDVSPGASPGSAIRQTMAGCDIHLVIVHHPGQQAIADLRQIAAEVRRIDRRIGAFIVSATQPQDEVMQIAAEKPTLVYSPSPLGKVAPLRGKVYQGGVVPKFKQLQMLAAAGVRVPQTQVLLPGTTLDPEKWGEFVVIKPLDMATSSKGLGVQLMRTSRVRFVPPRQYPEGHPGRRGPMVAQQFIDTGVQFSNYRVLTLFGAPLYSLHLQSVTGRADLGADDATIEISPIATQQDQHRQRSFVYKADMAALARKVHEAIPEIPLKGIDMIRDVRTGQLYVLEINPGGNTWHMSSRYNAEVRADMGPELAAQLYTQLDALGTAAHALADVTRREAA